MCSSFWKVLLVLVFNYDFSSSQDSIIMSILNGEVSESYESPWKVAIFRNDSDGEFEYKCGGSLINKDTVVTGKKSNN